MAIDIVNPYDVAVSQFDEAADHLGLSQAMRAIFREPKRELIVNFPVRMGYNSHWLKPGASQKKGLSHP